MARCVVARGGVSVGRSEGDSVAAASHALIVGDGGFKASPKRSIVLIDGTLSSRQTSTHEGSPSFVACSRAVASAQVAMPRPRAEGVTP